jgi:hypothetical protein
MRKLAFFAVLLPLVLAPGCPVRKFEVRMNRTDDGKVQRELTVWTSEDSKTTAPSPDVLDAAKLAYGDSGNEVDEKFSFVGTFEARLPADLVHEGLANHAFVGTSTCPMGSVVTYVERMPGRSDLVALLTDAGELADTFARVWVAWARQQPSLQADPEKLEKLVAFIEGDLRNDALNIMLMGWRAVTRGNILEDAALDEENEDESDLWQAEYLGGVSYLVERGYYRPDEVALLHESNGRVVMRGILRKAAAAMGCAEDGPWPAALEQLRDPNAVEAAFEQGLAAIGLTSEQLEAQYAPLLPEIFGTSTRGRVVWQCPAPPLETNGDWDEEKHELAWEAEGRQGCETPQLLYAFWAEPDEPFQNEHLGSVMLVGEHLADYIAWRAGLVAAQRNEWDAFIAGLQPDRDVVKQLEQFQFATPTTKPSTMPADAAAGDLTQGAKLILGR